MWTLDDRTSSMSQYSNHLNATIAGPMPQPLALLSPNNAFVGQMWHFVHKCIFKEQFLYYEISAHRVTRFQILHTTQLDDYQKVFHIATIRSSQTVINEPALKAESVAVSL